MNELVYRPLSESEWPLVQKLMRDTPMTSTMPLVIQRPADSFATAYPRLSGRDYNWGCFADGILVGYYRILIGDYFNGREFELMGYISDVRINPQYRGRGILQAFSKISLEEGQKLGGQIAFAFSNTGNDILTKAIAKIPWVETQVFTQFQTTSYFLTGLQSHPSTDRFVEIKKPALEQIPALQQGQLFINHLDVQGWSQFLTNFPEIRFFALKDKPNHVCFSLWNTEKIRRYSFTRYPASIKAIRTLWNASVGQWKAMKIPPAGQAWPIVDICFVDPQFRFDQNSLSFCKSEAQKLNGLMMNLITRMDDQSALSFESSFDLAMKVTTELKGIICNKTTPPHGSDRCFVNLSLM